MDAPLALPHEEAGVFQNAKMFGDCRQRHLERLGELADCPLAEREAGQDRAARRIAERGEGGVERMRIVNHLV